MAALARVCLVLPRLRVCGKMWEPATTRKAKSVMLKFDQVAGCGRSGWLACQLYALRTRKLVYLFVSFRLVFFYFCGLRMFFIEFV